MFFLVILIPELVVNMGVNKYKKGSVAQRDKRNCITITKQLEVHFSSNGKLKDEFCVIKDYKLE